MLKSASYIYLVSRAHGLSTRLIKPNEYESLKKAKDLNSLIDLISGEEYVKRFSSVERDKLDASTLNRVFAEVLVDRLVYFTKISSGKFRDFMLSYVRRLEIENLRRVLRAKLGERKISVEDLLPIPRGYTIINFQDLVNVRSLDDVSYHLTPTIYRVAQESFAIAKSIGSTFPIELVSEAIYFSKLIDSAMALPSSRRAVEIIRSEYFSKLAYYILGLKFLDASLLPLEKFSSIIARNLGVSIDFINDLLRAREDTLINIILRSRYRWLIPYIENVIPSKSVTDLYRGVLKAFKGYYGGISKRYPLDMAYILWYLYSVEYEYLNLVQLATAKELGIPSEEIELY